MAVNLFSPYEELKEVSELVAKIKPKRVRADKPTYIKTYKNDIIDGVVVSDDIEKWGKIRKLHIELSSFFLIELMTNRFENREFFEINNFIRLWKSIYNTDSYIYKGTIYKGQEFQVLEAEIIGTEDFNIDERLYLHELLILELKANKNIDEIKNFILKKVQLLQKGLPLKTVKFDKG